MQEEFDEELQQPDKHGVLEMSHRAWAALDDRLFNWYGRGRGRQARDL